MVDHHFSAPFGRNMFVMFSNHQITTPEINRGTWFFCCIHVILTISGESVAGTFSKHRILVETPRFFRSIWKADSYMVAIYSDQTPEVNPQTVVEIGNPTREMGPKDSG